MRKITVRPGISCHYYHSAKENNTLPLMILAAVIIAALFFGFLMGMLIALCR